MVALLASWFALGLVACTSGDAVDGQLATRTGLPAVSAPATLSVSPVEFSSTVCGNLLGNGLLVGSADRHFEEPMNKLPSHLFLPALLSTRATATEQRLPGLGSSGPSVRLSGAIGSCSIVRCPLEQCRLLSSVLIH
jgi:hypothetical protein